VTAPPEAQREVRHTADLAALTGSFTDPDRFVALFDAYYPEIHRYAHSRLGSGVAEDVAS
jgi:hypothetical protein